MRSGRAKRAESRYRESAASLAARIRTLRLRRGLTQEQLASDARVAVSTVRKIESATVVEPGYFTVRSIAAALGASLLDLDE